MAVKYHISPASGRPNICRAEKSCPIGNDNEHFASKDEARAAYESKMSGETFAPVSKASKKADLERAQELKESVADYRNANTSESERENIRAYWKKQGVANQFSAMLKAAEISKNDDEPDEDFPVNWEDELEKLEPALDELEEHSLDDDFSDIKCDGCGRNLDSCVCDICEYCGSDDPEWHEEDCPKASRRPKAYSWD